MSNLLLRRRMLMQAGGSPTPPIIPYQRVEYLESDGDQYISTGFTCTTNSEFFLDLQLTDGTGDRKIFGQAVKFGLAQLNGVWRLCANWIMTRTNTDTNRHTIYTQGNDYYLDGVKFATTAKQAMSRAALVFAACNGNGVPDGNKAKMKLYRIYIKDSDIIVFDGYPVRDNSIGYLYDIVSEQLFSNAGTGDFILGPDIN